MGVFHICNWKLMKAFLTKKIVLYFRDIDSENWLFIFGVQTLNLTLYVFEESKVSNAHFTV